jgi:hypothetical protein
MKKVDILSYSAIKDSEQGFDLVMKTPDGQDMEVIFTIIGKYAEPVQHWSKKIFAEWQRENDIAKRKGKEPESKTIDELRDQNIDGASVRVIGWKNVEQEFSKDILKQVLAQNPHWVDQIVEESDNAGNFTKAL